MTQQELVDYMYLNGCPLFKTTRYHTFVFRNKKSGKKGSISIENTYMPISVVALCKSVRITCPDHMREHDGLLNDIIKEVDEGKLGGTYYDPSPRPKSEA